MSLPSITPVKRSDTCIVKSPSAVVLYISTHGMPLVQSNYLVATNLYNFSYIEFWNGKIAVLHLDVEDSSRLGILSFHRLLLLLLLLHC